MKKSKVTKIVMMDKKDSYGNTSFIITFENGDSGFYTSKQENQTKFVIGQEAEYLIEQKQGSKGVYNKVTVPQSERPPFGGGGGKPQIDPRVQMISFAMAYTKDLVVASKVPMADLEKEFTRVYNIMISKL